MGFGWPTFWTLELFLEAIAGSEREQKGLNVFSLEEDGGLVIVWKGVNPAAEGCGHTLSRSDFWTRRRFSGAEETNHLVDHLVRHR